MQRMLLIRRKSRARIHGPVARSKVKERSCYLGAEGQGDRPGAILEWEKRGRSVILRSGRRSLRGGCERNVGESRKEWQLVAEAQQKGNEEDRTG